MRIPCLVISLLVALPALAQVRETGEARAVRVADEEADAAEKETVGWDYVGKHETDHFLIYYGTGNKVAERLAVYGEALYETFHETFGDLVEYGERLPLKVYLFKTKKQYREFALARAPGFASPLFARFDPATGASYICQQGSPDKFLVQSFVHENTHALCWRLMLQVGGPGSWIMEGWADYMALSVDFKKKGLSLGRIYQVKKKSDHLGMMKLLFKTNGTIPLATLIEMNRLNVARQGLRAYPQAWSLFYFLRHYGGDHYRKGLENYIKGLAEGRGGGKEAFEKTIGPIERIEGEWRDYVRTLSAKRGR